MGYRFFNLLFLVGILCLSCVDSNNSSFEEQYFGQNPPGMTPEVFAPGRLTGAGHGFPTFSPDGKEIYWSIIQRVPDQRPKGMIMGMKYENGHWTQPKQLPFTGEHLEQAANLALDGKRLYFQSLHPDGHGSLDIWFVEKTDTGWSAPKNVGPPLNSEKMEGQPSFTKEGTVYFTGRYQNGGWGRGIYRSEWVDGQFSTHELLPLHINTEHVNTYPFVASDESFILFASSRPTMEESDIRLFVSFRTENDTWTEPINLSRAMEFDQTSRFPYITPDGQYLFFCSNGEIYWVASGVIDRLKP